MLVQAMGGGPRSVSGLLAGALHAALAAARQTGGAVDPTAGPGARGNWKALALDPHRRILEIPPGMAVDLGATGKALVADRIARDVQRQTGSPVLVNLGGDISVRGARSWDVGIADDHAAKVADQVVRLSRGGIATSSTTVRPGHILDPATGEPVVTPWRTVTVAARSCLVANTASTAAIVMGERATTWLAAGGVAARLVRADGSVVRIGGWPA
jgi:thiamine biosynthesis lipoprotein